MIHQKPPLQNGVRTGKDPTDAIDLLKDAFVCVSIPVVTFAIAYIALDIFARLFLG
jgi:hypothetical protein